MSKTMSINSYLMISKWFKFDHFDQMIRSDFNLSEGLNFHRAGQASPPLGRSVAHHSKRPIHPIYSQLFSRERETTQKFLWLYDCDSYDFIQWRREREEKGVCERLSFENQAWTPYHWAVRRKRTSSTYRLSLLGRGIDVNQTERTHYQWQIPNYNHNL